MSSASIDYLLQINQILSRSIYGAAYLHYGNRVAGNPSIMADDDATTN